ncbi:uncharacterized protein LOC116665481 [Camelus ferus]|uniref:Uncharacterized protein LOC116665481 n=1 Tax=Camelus ferus TaxID=419612 RepID=A0A8B8TGA7_CAMFR|nr:uncharacterized protein LOC116665481 [Camelus ferus]XP_032341233.1 uncharacterized protein LOC116665481 [Camelus ferus]
MASQLGVLPPVPPSPTMGQPLITSVASSAKRLLCAGQQRCSPVLSHPSLTSGPRVPWSMWTARIQSLLSAQTWLGRLRFPVPNSKHERLDELNLGMCSTLSDKLQRLVDAARVTCSQGKYLAPLNRAMHPLCLLWENLSPDPGAAAGMEGSICPRGCLLLQKEGRDQGPPARIHCWSHRGPCPEALTRTCKMRTDDILLPQKRGRLEGSRPGHRQLFTMLSESCQSINTISFIWDQ